MEICPHCRVGKLESTKAVFLHQKDPQTVLVDRIPALICDACGKRTYDPRALEALHSLLWSLSNEPISMPISRMINR